jgi:LAS superfamily LD-carboxypeptidase LdcB
VEKVPSATVSGITNLQDKNCLEIKVNDVLICSNSITKFDDTPEVLQEIAEIVQAAANGGSPTMVTKLRKRNEEEMIFPKRNIGRRRTYPQRDDSEDGCNIV